MQRDTYSLLKRLEERSQVDLGLFDGGEQFAAVDVLVVLLFVRFYLHLPLF